jgi:hypothetical protein
MLHLWGSVGMVVADVTENTSGAGDLGQDEIAKSSD